MVGATASALLWLLAIAFLLKAEPSCAVDQVPWPMFQANPAHTGYVPVDLNPVNFSLAWQKTVATGKALNPVTAAEGKVFASLVVYFQPGNAFFAFDAADGSQLWSVDYGRVFSVNPPSYDAGKVYIQTGNHSSDTYLQAYDASSGAQIFRSHHSAQWERYFAPTPYAGKIYINGGYYGGMYAFDGTSGSQLWFKSLPQYDQWTPAVDANYAYSYLGSGGLNVIDRASGQLAFSIAGPNGSSTTVVLGAMGNVLAIQNGRLISFDLASRTIGYQVAASFTGQPSLAGGVIYCINAGALTARDEATGNLLWSWSPPSGTLTGTMVLSHSHLFTRTSSTTYAIDLSSHASVWSYPASGHLALGNDSLYIAGANGVLTAIALAPIAYPEPPILGAVGSWEVLEGTPLSFTVTAWDPNGDLVTYSVDPLPAGAAFDTTTGAFSWTPSYDQVGGTQVTFTASDGVLTDSETVTLIVTTDTLPPTGSIMINNGAAATNTMAVTLNLTAADTGGSGLAAMRFRNSQTDPYSPWVTCQTSNAWTLTSGEGTKRVYAQFMDTKGNVSDANPAASGAQGYMDSIVYDPTGPTGSILINNGAASTKTTAVTLNLLAADNGGSGLASMRFRNSETDPYSAWEPYGITKVWTLTNGAGAKRVYVQFRDRVGNISDANPVATGPQGYKDAIELKETIPPTGSIRINNNAASTSTPLVTLNLTAADTGGSGLASMCFRNGTAEPYSTWERYRTTKDWILADGPGIKKVYVLFKDGAGNISDSSAAAFGAQAYSDGINYTGP